MMNKVYKRIACLILCISMMCVCIVSLADTTNVTQVKTLDRGCNMRANPWMGDNIIKKIHADTTLIVHGMENGWYLVEYNGYFGYVDPAYTRITAISNNNDYSSNNAQQYNNNNYDYSNNYQSYDQQEEQTVMRVKTLDRGCNMRANPWMDDNIIAKIHANTILTVYNMENGWYYVEYNGRYGYVDPEYTMIIEYASPSNGYNDAYNSYNNDYSANSYDSAVMTGRAGDIGCNLRSSMNYEGDNNLIKKVHKGETMTIYSTHYDNNGGKWYFVRLNNGMEGYVNAGNVIVY